MKLLQFVYNHSPIFLQNIIITAYGLRLKSTRFGKVFKSETIQLNQTLHHTADKLKELQQENLCNLLGHAYKYVPHYKSVFQELNITPADVDISNFSGVLPIVTKDILKESPDRFVSSDFKSGQLTKIHTSGTTGAPLVVSATKISIQKNYAFFLRFLNMTGFVSGQSSATFAGRVIVPSTQIKPPFWRVNRAMNNVLFSSYHISEVNIPAYIQELERLNVKLIDSYPSAIYAISNYINKNFLQHTIRPQAIVTSSETLLEHQRVSIETAFNCKVFDQYGSAEMAAFMAQCSKGTYHAHSEYGIVEVLDDCDQPVGFGVPGRLICTGFLNHSMPLIRYDTGDTAILSERKCDCGLNFPVVESIWGRRDDLLVTPSGKMVGRLDPVFKGLLHIKETQIIQERLNKVKIKIVKDTGFTDDVAVELKRELMLRLGHDMEIYIEYVDSIPRTKSGKFRSVISNI